MESIGAVAAHKPLGDSTLIALAVRGVHTCAVSYPPVPIAAGDELIAELPPLNKTEYTDEARMGSTAEYRLLQPGGSSVEPASTHRGPDVLLHTVNAGRNNASARCWAAACTWTRASPSWSPTR